jgi:electron-transferring-flavoprotein dehydrogenase
MNGQVAAPEPRESMDFDVVIVGAGPAGLAAAIRLKQLDPDLSVVLVEKGSEVGAHILSGVVMDPRALDVLLPDWRSDADRPLKTEVSDDRFYYLGPAGALRLPNFLMPRLMANHGNFIGSLSDVTKYLAAQAEALGVDIYPGFAATEILYDDDKIVGIATGDMGIGKSGEPTSNYTRGMELRGRYTLFAEGARGSLTKTIIAKFGLHQNGEPQKYGIGLKELWRVRPEQHQPGLVQHTFGWPLDHSTGGGSFLYHFGENRVAVGFVVHLNYTNPTLSPYDEFQRFKTHPLVAPVLSGGERLAYGARAITEGGWQSVPDLAVPGGVLIGCAAGFVNVPRIKGSHNAIWSGMQAAEALIPALQAGRAHDRLSAYADHWRSSPIGRDLKPVRNVKPLWSRFGTIGGVALGGLDMWTNAIGNVSLFGTLKHGKPDHACLKPLADVKPILYPRPDGKLTFDKLSSVYLSGTAHEENQPPHLVLKDPSIPIKENLPRYGEPARLYCPAGVYEVVYGDEAAKRDPRFVINAQNCVHCKTCDIKDPAQNITWVPPEGSGGPNYSGM